MAKHPGSKDYAWHRSLVLDQDPSGMFTGISHALTLAMQSKAGQDAVTVSVGPSVTKRR